MKTSFALAIVWLTETELVLQTLLDSTSQIVSHGRLAKKRYRRAKNSQF